MHTTFHKKPATGFTLIEALFGIALFVFIGGAAWALQRDFSSLNTLVQSSLVSQHEINRTFKMMTAELRAASPSSLGAYPVADASANSITLYSDADNDGLKERIRYFSDGGTLQRGVVTPTGSPLGYDPADESVTTVIRDLSNGATPIFSYYDTGYEGATPPLAQPVDVVAIRLVKITVTVDKNGSKGPGAVTFTTQVSLRNLKDNYSL